MWSPSDLPAATLHLTSPIALLFQQHPQLRVLQRCSTHPLGVVGAAVVGMEELQTLAAFAKDQMKKSKSVRLSDVGASEWGHIQKNTGADQKLHSACFVVPCASQPS